MVDVLGADKTRLSSVKNQLYLRSSIVHVALTSDKYVEPVECSHRYWRFVQKSLDIGVGAMLV